MTVSVFDLFKVGIGPSSSHTVGPMRAAYSFASRLAAEEVVEATARVRCELYGSLGATGHGHGSVKAVVLGLAGEQPQLVDPVAEYYSVGGGFVLDQDETGTQVLVADPTPVPYPFATGARLLELAAETNLSISDLMLANERAWRSEAEIRSGLLHIWQVMRECVERGSRARGVLPGGIELPVSAVEC